MPGVYKEPPSRKVPFGAPGQEPCADDYVTVEEGYGDAPPPAGPAVQRPARPAEPQLRRSSARTRRT